MTRETEEVPASVRAEVYERDGGCCRVCGQTATPAGLHHLVFRSQGGDNSSTNLVTIGWTPGHDCHLRFAHGASVAQVRAALQVAVSNPGINALQLLRWHAVGKAPSMEETSALFWAKVDRRGAEECWEWQGSRTRPAGGQSQGYGQLSARALRQAPIKAHVMSFFLAHGRWPRPACLHRCDNPPCVNPAHLYEGTQQQNMIDRQQRRPRYGAANPAARHAGLVDQIRSRVTAGETQAQVAATLHLSSGVVSRIVRGINYPMEQA